MPREAAQPGKLQLRGSYAFERSAKWAKENACAFKGSWSAAEATAFLPAKIPVMDGSRRHLTPLDSLANVGIATQVLTLIETVLAATIATAASLIIVVPVAGATIPIAVVVSAIPTAASSVVAVSVLVIAVTRATILVAVITAAIGLSRDWA